MESSPSAILRLLIPKTPFILKTAVAHSLSLSHTSAKWDLRTELTVKILRDMLGPKAKPSSIEKNQKLTTKDPGVKGSVWVSKVQFPEEGAEDEVRRTVLRAVEELCMSEGSEKETWTEPASRPLEAEWTGYRAGVNDNTLEPPNLSEADKYANILKETTSRVTVLYFHGGAMYLLDPSTYRNVTGRIAQETGGRVFNVRYRLAPQNPFPAALLDAFTAYLGLLYPPAGAPHAPVPASEIVFAGDSAGGMLCTALLQLLLQIHRSHNTNTNATNDTASSKLPQVKWQGTNVPIPLPAGLALTSPWLDTTRSLPSITSLAHYDYLPTPAQTRNMSFIPDAAWPATPPRVDLYSEGSALLHPLVSPLMARDWSGAPPVFFSVGEEMLRDEDAVVAKRMHAQGVSVVWKEFEAMPHVFAAMLGHLGAAGLHYGEMAAFCRDVVEGGIQSSAEFIRAKSLVREKKEVGEITQLSDEEVWDLCKKGKDAIVKKDGDAALEAKPML
ncbi:acetyl-hydrolase [Massarina eburnea CBS 473.64]|uniref:Acetyl-hydrolase n=1 Tax=Massarina eburnea CBS 473.64 TaxID=1395130 RepID=A0A6A6SEL9_9PLEO|nr:acetyl-hydrolase [Massarina eburnea CBS 473.64]